jgi:PAS domain S-box-containing protein
MSFLDWLFSTEGFVPRWECGSFSPALGWTHILSDASIFGAYLAIPVVLVYFVLRRRDVPFTPVFWLFAAFILFCGLGHLVEASLFWSPHYRFSALVKVLTALASWATVAALIPLAPRVLALREQKEELERHVRERTEELSRANEALRASKERMTLSLGAARVGTWEWQVGEDNIHSDEFMGPLFGLPPGGFPTTYDGFAALLHPDDREEVRQAVARSVNEAVPYDARYRVIWPDGTTHCVAARGKVYRDERGQAVRMVGVCWDATQRMLDELALRASEQRMRLVLDTAHNAFIAIDQDGDIVEWNTQSEETFGWTRGEALGRCLADTIIPPRHREAHRQGIRRFLQTGQGHVLDRRIELSALHKGGREFPVELTISPLREGNKYYFSAFLQDISERHRAAEALQRSNAELRQAQNALADVAAQLAMPTGEPRPEPYRLSAFSLTDMMELGADIRRLRRDCASSETFAGAVVRLLYERVVDDSGLPAFGLVRFFELRPFADLDEHQRFIAATSLPTIHDDTRCLVLVATAGELPQWNERSRSGGHQAIPLASPEAVERLPMVAHLIRSLGFEVEGVLRPDEALLLPRPQTNVFHVEQARGSPYLPAQDFVERFGIHSTLGFGGLNPDGRLFALVLFSKVPVSRDVAALFGYLSLSTQIALLSYSASPGRTEAQITTLDRLLRNHEEVVAGQERKLNETMQALRKSNRELEEFAYVASHDLQEPLRKVQMFGDMLTSQYQAALGDEGRDYLQRMQNAGRRMQTLITDLLAYSRVTTKGQPLVPVSLAEVAQQALLDLECRLRDTNGKVELGEMPEVQGDPLQLRQLLQNLISNGLKYHKKGEPPVVRVWAEPIPDEGRWLLHVADNGIGFDEKYLSRIFAPFQRLHGRGEYEGTGMGLAICRRIVERHGGSITARSAPGQGATFLVTLSAAQPDPEVADE